MATTHLSGEEACLFPILNAHCNEPRIMRRKDIDLPPRAALVDFCENHAVQMLSLFQTGWALVLHAYIGSKSPVFGCQFPTENGDGQSWICCMTLLSGESLLNMIKTASLPDAATLESQSVETFNTAVVHEHAETGSNVQLVLEVNLAEATASLAFSSSIMSNEQASSVAATFAQAIQETMKNPHSKPIELDLCSQHDKHVLSGWNNNIPEKLDARVDEMIFRQGQQDPSHVAVSSWDGKLTYGELDRLSSSLAGHLANKGVRCGMFVPLCFEKTKWTVLAMLGVIKAGGAYVLLDPSYPSKRMESICQDVDATILLASPQTIGKVQTLVDNVVVVDETSPIWSGSHDWSRPVSSQDALYAAFTSGSTGRPKGIVVEHGAFCTRALSNGAVLKLNKDSRVLQFASYAFDVSHRDILFTLIHKGTICIPSDTDRVNNLELFINRHQINWASLTPSVAGLLDPKAVPTLQTLVLAGEAMSAVHLSTWADKVQLMNAYGPSECIAVSCINPRVAMGSDRTNIGRGVGSAVWIVDPEDANRLAPIGAIGELVIETAAISRGYMKDQEKTEAAFPTHLRWRKDLQLSSQGRLYKTGDLGRFNVDGTISFAGRKDSQVKINGQRVELAEIEHHMLQVLASSPEGASTVQVVVDIVMPKESHRPTLVAFVYQIGNEQKSEAQRNAAVQQATANMADQLAKLLPVYMIPSVCVPVERIPMTGTSKTDRRALRQLGASMTWDQMAALTASTPSYRAPATEREQQLQRMFMDVLDLEADRVGADDSFLRLGGDSIDAMRLVTAVRKQGLNLTVADVFRNPRLNELAQLAHTASEPEEDIVLPFSLLKRGISASDARREAASLCGIQEDQVEDLLPCTPLQEGLLALTARSKSLYIRRFKFEIRPDVDVSQLIRSWEQTVTAVPLLRTRIVDLTRQGLVQVVVKEPVHWQSNHDLQSMGLGTPLARCGIVTEQGKTYLALTIHHATYDGWSMPLVLDTAQRIYRGQQHSLTPFAAFIKYVASIDENAATKFWRRQFVGLDNSEFPPLPFSHQPRADQILTHRIDVDWKGLDFTAATMIRATLSILISRYTNCPDAVFGATAMGRQSAVLGVESMAGPTFTTLPVRVMVDEEQTVHGLLQQVHSQATDMIPYEQMGLQRIRRISEESDDACQFQTLLLVQPEEEKVSKGSGLFVLEDEEEMGDTRLEAFTSYALMFRCELNKRGMRLRTTFDPSVLHERQATRMAHQLAHVLQQVCVSAAGDTLLRQIEMATPQDLSDIWAWNGAPPRQVDSVWGGVLPSRLDDPVTELAGHVPWVIQEHSESKLAAVGCIGELWLEIPVNGQGHVYKTAASLAENPQWLLRGISDGSGRSGRLYKTGELAKYTSNGAIVVLGRKDTLSRINGRRVNLRDIEQQVRQAVFEVLGNGSISVVAEIVTPRGSQSPMLVAFLCHSTDLLTSSIANAIDEELSERLPVKPHAYGILKDGAGRVDGNKPCEQAACFTLAELTVVERRDRDRATPQTEAECQLRDLWATVLDIPAERIRLHDSFFRLGGDSISAMRLVGAAHRHGISLMVADIFSYPQLKGLATVIKATVAADQAVACFSLLNLPLTIDEKRAQTAALCGVEPSLVQDAFPCTPLQAGLLARTAQSPGDYIARKVFPLRETTDVNRLAMAWAEVMASTPILRTRIVDLGGQGLVQVNVNEEFSWKTESDLNRYIRADSEEPMGLGTPLARFGLVDCGLQKYCIMTLHHAMYDGWLMSLLLQALHKAYHGQPRMVLTTFQPFIKAIYSADEASMADFWKAQLNGLEAPIFPAVSVISPRTDSFAMRRIEALRVDSSDTTISMAIRAAWAILSAQYVNAREALFGALVTGRQCSVPGIELVGGPTIATVPVRVAVDRESTIAQLLQQVQTQAVQMIPFEQSGLQRIRRVSSDADQACQFQTLLVVQPMDADHQRTLFTPAQQSSGLSSVDPYALVLECKLLKQGVRAQINYDSRILQEHQAQRLLQQFDHVLRQVCAGHHTTKVKDVGIISDSDLHDVWKWNAHVPAAQGVCVHNLISDRTQKQREALAIDAWDGRFTYGQLDELSTRLAHRLVLFGVGPEIFVPLLFEKSRWTPVAMLGVVKAGGAFVLLELNHPLTRLQAIYAEVNAHIVVSSPAQAAKAANLATTVVAVGDGQDIGCDGGKLTTTTSPKNTIYAVFTSGSTGKPKGALLHHDGFATNALAYNDKLGLGSDLRVLQFSSHAFDVCIMDIFFTLIGGGCICIPSSSEAKDNLSGAIRQFNANYVTLTPSVLRTISPSEVPTLTTLAYIGESASKNDFSAWCDSVRLVNVYGPTECSVFATVQPHITTDSDPLNIGSPVAGVCWVAHPADSSRLVPVGAVGELVLEGPLVGQGYIDSADKTAEAFFDGPSWLVQGCGNQPGRHGRVYKTGDLVRYASDGTLQFLGRKDTQVKLRGQRIELGEIEHHVHQVLTTIYRQQHFDEDATLEVVAEIIRPQESGRPTLVAFASIRNSGLPVEESIGALHIMVADLNAQLADRLPVYMIPSTYFPLERIPLGTTGKTDRRRLREIGSLNHGKMASQRQAGQRVAPSTEMESLLLELWMNVLNLPAEAISVDSAWNRLGGDSITAMQLVSRCRARSIQLTAGDVLRAQTIQGLAKYCSLIQDGAPVLSSTQTIEEEPWGLTPVQHLFFDNNPDGLNHFNQSFLLRIKTPVSTDSISAAIHHLAERHPMLRARFQRGLDGEWQQYVASYQADVIAFAAHHVENASIASLAQSRQEQLDIQHGPVFAADVFSLPCGKQILLLSAHHLVIDLVSWRVLWHEIRQSLLGHLDAVTRPTTSFQAWCKVQSQMAQSLMPSQVLPFVVDTSGYEYWGVDVAQNTQAESETHLIRLEMDVTSKLLGPSNERLRTEPIDILLGVLFHSFRQVFADRPPPPVFIEGHGREALDNFEIDPSEIVGWLTTIFPICISSGPNDTIVDMTKLAKDIRRSVPGNGLPYATSRHLTPTGQTAFREHDKVEVLLSYAGIYQQMKNDDSLLSREMDPVMTADFSQTSPMARRMGLVELNLGTQFGRLTISCTLHRRMKHQTRLRQWIKVFADSLTKATHELLTGPKSFTLSDFPLLSLSYTGLDSLEKTIQAAGIPHDAVEDIYPCTPMQEGILLSIQKGTSSYMNHRVWRCEMLSDKTPVCPTHLEAAWRRVVNRHSILSTVFVPLFENGLFAQVLVANSPVRVDQIRCGSWNPVDTLMECGKPVFAAGEPQHQLAICQSSSGDVACRLDMNHALNDAESTIIIANDLAKAYEGVSQSEAPRFRDLMQHLGRTPAADRMKYWRMVLMDVSPCRFPVRNNSAGVLQGDHGYIPLSDMVTSRIYAFCVNRGITRSVFVQIAWAMALSWYTGIADVCFGYMASGRSVPIHNIEDMVGPLANMLISRVDVGQSLNEVIEKTAESSIEHLAHQHVSLAQIQHELKLGHVPLFNSCVTVRKREDGATSNQLRFQRAGGDDPHEFPVSVSALLEDTATVVGLGYRKEFFSFSMAQDISSILTMAIEHILYGERLSNGASERFHHSDSLRTGFFQSVVGTSQQLATNFWQQYFANLDTQHFPSLPSPFYSPQATSTLSYCLQGFQWSRTEVAASTAIRVAWAVLLARYANTSDVVTGVLTKNSKLNLGTVPLRMVLGGEASLHQLLEDIQGQIIAMEGFEQMGLHNIQSVSDEAEQGCQFQTLLIEAACEDGLNFSGPEAFGLILQCLCDDKGLHIQARFDSNMIEEAHVERMMRQFEHVLRQFHAEHNQLVKVKNITLACEEDMRDIWAWNQSVPESVEACMHEQIAAMVRKQPDALAICAWDGELTYYELDTLSTRLAYHLMQYLDGNTTVPLYFEKSLWTTVAMLAVMKAGGASLALDTTQPEGRLATLVEQIQPRLILSSAANAHMAGQIAKVPFIVVDRAQLDALETFRSLPVVQPSANLYIIFTSGSTGKPKGTLISHANFASAVLHQQDMLQLGPGARLFDVGSYAFDVAWGNVLHTLSSGGCLCVPESATAKDDLLGSLRQYRATHAELTPTLARALVPDDLPDLQCFISSGEALDDLVLQRWSKVTRILNAYGPAECSAISTIAELTSGVPKGNIGRGLGLNSWIVSLQNDNELAPVYGVGELWLEGPLVGQGYLNQAQRTIEAFVDSPPWLTAGGRRGRLYKTGDLVRYHTDGSLIFIGRKDTQVKIRGQRIELAEVEHHVLQALSERGDAVLTNNETIHIVAEAIKPCDGSHAVLVAFVSRESQDQSSRTVREMTAGLEEKLSKFLPAYMIPTAYIPIEQLPLTASGKTDRLKLQQLASALTREDLALLTAGEQEKRAPRTKKETVLQRLCASVLAVSMDIIGLDDSFFRLGGDSIAAIKLVAMARLEGWSITVASIFSQPKLSDLALAMEVLQEDSDRPPPPFSLLPDGSAGHVRDTLRQLGIDDSAVEDAYPCTALQEGLITMTVKNPDAYVHRTAFTMPVDVDPDVFRAAWDATVIANPILRTRLIQTESGMFQAVVRGSIEWEAATSMEEYLADDHHRQMDLGVPLLRLALVRQANTPLSFVLTIHHALYDGFSLPLILQQVQKSYTGNALQLHPFSSFVAHLAQVDKKAERDFWVSRFANLRAPTFPALSSATYIPGSRMSFTQSITLGHGVGRDFTLATLIRLAWAVVIAQHTDSDDVVFGETLTGRNASFANLDRLTGPTITTIPIRVELRSDQSLAEALDGVRKNMLAAIPYEQAGLQNIRQMSSEAAAACEFQSHLGIQPLEEDLDYSTLFGQRQSRNSSDQFSSYAFVLLCSLSSNNQEIGVECNFDPSIVDEDEARRHVGLFQTILRQLCSNPEQKIGDLQVISPADIAQLVKWNADLPSARQETLHNLILNHCISQPDRTAISSWDGTVTYAELDVLSRALALHLISTGVESNTIVLLCFQRSKWSVISILAVLRTGAACLLVDPTHPPDRIQDFVEQSRAVTAVVDPLQAAFMQGMVTNVITVSSALIDGLDKSKTVPLPTVASSNTAFIVFTSGSTGKPKGIILEHVQLSTSIRDHGPGMGVNSDSRSLHFASYAFDASIYEICTTLVSGGCLYVLSEHERMNDLAAFIRSQKVTWATLPNSATNLLHPDEVPSLQTLVLGGEAVTQDVVEKWAPRLTLINGYGPAEATICALGPIPVQGWKPGTFGNVVGGVGWIATPSDASKLAAIGSVGELLIEGPVLARGYLNNPEKTASSFLEDLPWMKDFRPAGKGRVYKSGDLVQYNPDGTFRFVGRKDTQVKLRGQRIELGEVEFRIRQCLPELHNVVAEVIVPSGPNANSLLAAFIHLTMTTDGGKNLFLNPTEELRAIFFAAQAKLRSMVPGYMVPGLFIPLSRIPRTTAGKIDRRQLRDRASALPRVEFDLFMTTRYQREKPDTETEEKLQAILSSVTDLSVDEIGVKDNIFHLGADSITAMKIVTAARKQDISISVADIFSHPTIYDLARLYDAHNPQHQAVSSVVPGSVFGFTNQRSFIESIDCSGLPFNASDIYDALPASQGQEDRLVRGSYYFMLDFDGPIDYARLEKACRGLIQRHTIFRTVFISYQGRIAQIVLRNPNTRLEIVKSDDCLVRFTESFCQTDSREAPMLGDLITRMTLVQGSDHRNTLILRISHAQYDGMSMSIIWRDLVDLYEARQLPDPIEYSTHVQKWLAAGTPQAYQFWRNLLDASSMTYIKQKHLAEENASVSSPIYAESTVTLPDPPHGITIATLIKAAWSLVLTQLTGDRDVVFGQTNSGRSSSSFDAENLVGLCINAIPVRVKYNPTWSFLDLLHHVQEQHGDSLTFESVELRDIVSRSTPWPRGTWFGSIVTFQNIDVDKPFSIGGTQPSMRLFHQNKPPAHISISAYPRGQELLIELLVSNQTLSEPHAQKIAQRLGEMIISIARCPHRHVFGEISM